MVCHFHIFVVLERFHRPKRKTPEVLAVTPHPLLPAPGNQNPLSVPMHLPVLDISYKWVHTTCSLFCLASFTQRVFKVHLPCTVCQYFVPFIADWSSIVWKDHIYFMHSSLMDIWVVPLLVNSAAVNMYVQFLSEHVISTLWGGTMLGRMIILRLTYWGPKDFFWQESFENVLLSPPRAFAPAVPSVWNALPAPLPRFLQLASLPVGPL